MFLSPDFNQVGLLFSLKVLSNWQRFRDEQLILLNWLSNKEKLLKEMGRTDLTDEEEVKRHLQNLRVRIHNLYCASYNF